MKLKDKLLNGFVPVTPFETVPPAERRRAESAFNIAEHAFGVFAFLHNKYCVTARVAAGLPPLKICLTLFTSCGIEASAQK